MAGTPAPLMPQPGETGRVAIASSTIVPIDGPSGPYELLLAWPDTPPPATGYPVLYLLDGKADFGTAVDSLRAQSRQPASTGVAPGLVVGIGYPGAATIDLIRRTSDYTPAVPAGRLGHRPNGEAWPPSGGAEPFRRFLVEAVRQAVAARWPIDHVRQALFGHSFGGLFVLDTLLEEPQSFSAYIASSPSLWWGEALLPERLEARPRPAPLPHARVRISAGGLEETPRPGIAERLPDHPLWLKRNRMIAHAQAFAGRLEKDGVDARFHLFDGENHGSVVPAALSRAVALAFSPNPREPS